VLSQITQEVDSMKRILLAAGMASAALVTAGLTAPAALASAPNATCTGDLPPGTYQNVTVPAQATCGMNGTDNIIGNVTVATGATLQDGGAAIGGNLQADHAANVTVAGTVGGDVQLTATSGVNGVCDVTVGHDLVVQNSAAASSIFGCNPFQTLIRGNLTVQNNTGTVSVMLTTVAGNISVHNNTGGGTGVAGNFAGGNCQLFNDNPPLLGSANNVPPGHQNTCNQPG
jgi:hypothetical protein